MPSSLFTNSYAKLCLGDDVKLHQAVLPLLSPNFRSTGLPGPKIQPDSGMEIIQFNLRAYISIPWSYILSKHQIYIIYNFTEEYTVIKHVYKVNIYIHTHLIP